MNGATKREKQAVELRRAIERAMTQLVLALNMDDEPDALLAVIECVEEHLGQTARNHRETSREIPDALKWSFAEN